MVSLQVALMAVALSGTGPTVLLDFYSDSCSPCRAMNPTVQALIAKGYPVQRVNRDKNPTLVAQFNVKRIPCFIMVVDGRVVDRIEGGTTFSRLERMCKTQGPASVPNPPAPMLAENRPPAAQSAVQPALYTTPATQPFPDARGNMPITIPIAAAQPQATGGVSDAALLSASVRLRIKDPDGWSSGSGTIIDTRGGEALVLTCGHIFRDSRGAGSIEVDLFGPNEARKVEGRLISYDLNRDVGIVAFRVTGPIVTMKLAPPGYRLVPGMPVASVGCNNGDAPTVRRSQITSLDKFLGPPNIQVNDQPVQGRSGGGLFSSDGYVIGVCNAADPSDKEGLFAALGSIYAELDQQNMAYIYKSPNVNPGPFPPEGGTTNDSNPLSSANNLATFNSPVPSTGDRPNFRGSDTETGAFGAAPSGSPAKLQPHEQAALDEIHRRLKEGSEVICVIRPRGKPEAQSEVIMLDRASPEFVKQIANEGRRPEKPFETSLGLPKPRKILLEWSSPGNGNGQ